MGQLKILRASAGSGKTFMLSYEYVKNVIQEPLCYKGILAVTFTNKATEEMKSRILNELHNLTLTGGKRDFLEKLISEESMNESVIRVNASRALTYILHDYSNFAVMTIDGFFQKIVRSFVKELHLESDYTIDFNTNYLLTMAIDILIRKSDNDATLRSWIDGFIEENIELSKSHNLQDSMLSLSGMVLSDQFDRSYFENNRDALISFFNNLFELKRTIVDDIKSLGVNFINNCNNYDLTSDDFPGKSTGLYSYIKKIANGDIVEASNSIIKNIVSDSSWVKKGRRLTEENSSFLKKKSEEIYYKVSDNIRLINTINALSSSYRTFVILADISKELYDVCSSKNKMLLSNSNYLINRLIKGNDTPYIYEKIGNHYEVMMIDEFQDTSQGQWENFIPLLENTLSQSPEEKNAVTIVGDVKQSIYRWRGGDWRILSSEILKELGNNKIVYEKLNKNYRSKKEIVDFNNNIISKCVKEIDINLNSNIAELSEGGKISNSFAYNNLNLINKAYEEVAQLSPKNDGDGGYIEVIQYEKSDDLENPHNLVQTIEIIKDLQDRGYKARDIAILVRSKNRAKEVANYIIEYKKNNPELSAKYCFDIISADGLSLNRSRVVKFIMSVYQLSAENKLATKALYNRFLGRALNSELPLEDSEFISSLPYLPIIESFEKIVNRYSLGDHSNNMAYLQAMHTAIITFNSSETGGVFAFINWWNSEKSNLNVNLPEGQNAIKIDTIHKSKGLQYRVVIIPFCQWGLAPTGRDNFIWANSQNEIVQLPNSTNQKSIIPYSKSLSNSYYSESYLSEYILSVIENFNIFYVALTRAEEELYVMIPTVSNSDKISRYINSVLPLLDMEQEVVNSNILKHKYGAKLEHSLDKNDTIQSSIHIETFKHNNYHNQIHLHLESDKYFKEMGSDGEVSENINARGKGIMLHKLFENIESLDELDSRINIMHSTGKLSKNDSVELKNIAIRSINDPLISSWFSSDWSVKSENSIILPNTTGDNNTFATLRPDRVIIKDNKAIIIDYKFGMERASHIKQIQRYKELLESMGYSNVDGYLWYIISNSVKKV